ncbi:MAG: hypothetical protein H7842_04335 [Gammaproteobacteria bacterium SHHR-1]|uniref:Asd/ArgC dimerization domain-containing protein n=1 Tax=Magnetovirga frankeli TaxID=947516 RepID=UPI001293E7CD|nr:hypothetical protein D5125_12855 [gamma proteobacterium SS-5]
MGQGIALAVLGAAGLNGENLLQLLAESSLAYRSLRLLDDDSQLGRKLSVGDALLPLETYPQAEFHDIDLVLACEPPTAELVQRIGEQGASLIAPASALSGAQPLVAELNLGRVSPRKGDALALPPAEACIMARLLSPLHDELGLHAVHSHWVRSVGLQGRAALQALAGETVQLLNGKRPKPGPFPQPIAFNLLSLDSRSQEQDLRHLWASLWGDNYLILSINSVLAPLFFGDIVSISMVIEQPSNRAEIGQLLASVEDLSLHAEDETGTLTTADSKDGRAMRLGHLRQTDAEGRCFSFQIALDAARDGFARNLLKVADNLAKNLFISYS